MENTNINISALENVDIDRILMQTIKEKIEKLMEIELNAYLEENPGIKNGKYKRDLKTKYGEIKQLNIPRDRESNFHTQVIEPYNRSIGMEDLIVSMYSNGISTRRIAGILEDILGNKHSYIHYIRNDCYNLYVVKRKYSLIILIVCRSGRFLLGPATVPGQHI